MKKVVITIFILFCFSSLAGAQDTSKIRPHSMDHRKIQKIDIRELPEIIKQKLSSEDYTSWILHAAYKVPAGHHGEMMDGDTDDYIVELKKENEIIRVRFDNAGNRKGYINE